MTTLTISKPGPLVLVALTLLYCGELRAQDSPHWDKNACMTCHIAATPTTENANLQAADAETLCETCHGDRGDAPPCRHSSGIPVGAVSLPDTLLGSVKDGDIVCTTCHDIVHQCERPMPHFSLQNPGFLRDRTSHEDADYCLKCHETEAYARLSPHIGVSGSPPRPTCLLCHANLPETNATGQLVVEFNMNHDLNDTCRGCHDVRPHPRPMFVFTKEQEIEWIHLVVPSEEVLENMGESQAATGIELPLDASEGKISCATCHNPHDFKVGGEHGSVESGMEHRLRQNDICQACHDK